jgi:hypothetical protein
MAAQLTMVLLTLLVSSPGRSAYAEEERVDGMGRSAGWVVATAGGDLAFVDCHGHRSALGSARVEPASRRCPSAPAPFAITCVVRRVDTARRIIHAEDEAGQPRAFHVTEAVPFLETLQPGDWISAAGPIDGQVTKIDRR